MSNENITFGQKVVEGGMWLSFSALAVKTLSLGSTILILRIFTVAEYGTYQLVLAAFGFMASFFVTGLDPLVVNDLAREKGEGKLDRVKKLWTEYSLFKLILGVVLFLVTWGGASFISSWYSPEIGGYLRLMSLLFLFMALERSLYLLFNIYLKFNYLSWFAIIEESAKLLFFIIFVIFLQRGVGGLVLAYMFSTALAVLIFLPLGVSLLKSLWLYPAASESPFLFLLRAHGKWGLAARYSADAQKSVRPWLIQFFLGREAVGLYSLAEGIYLQAVSLLPLSNILAPLLPQEMQNKERIRKVFVYGMKYGTVIFIAVGLIAFFGLPPLIKTFFPRYLPALPLFNIMIFAFLLTAPTNIVTTILYSYREQKLLFFLLALRLAFMIVGGVLLLKFFGLLGIAVEFVLTAVFFFLIRYYSVRKLVPEIRVGAGEFFRFDRHDFLFLQKMMELLKKTVGQKSG